MLQCWQTYRHRCTNTVTMFGKNLPDGEWKPYCSNCQVIVNEVMGLEDDFVWVKIDFSQTQRDIDDPDWIYKNVVEPVIESVVGQIRASDAPNGQAWRTIFENALYEVYTQGRNALWHNIVR